MKTYQSYRLSGTSSVLSIFLYTLHASFYEKEEEEEEGEEEEGYEQLPINPSRENPAQLSRTKVPLTAL